MSIPKTVIDHIDAATYEELNELINYAAEIRKIRARMDARKLLATLNVGDSVVFTGGKPKYLTGEWGVVIEKRGNKALIKLDRPQGKFIDGRVLAPLTLIAKRGR